MARTLAGATHSVQSTRTAQSKRTSGRRFPIRIRYILVVGVCIWAGIHYFVHQHPEWEMLNTRQQTLNHQLSALQSQHEKLQQQEKQLHDNAYIEKVAAHQYNLTMPNQVLFNVSH